MLTHTNKISSNLFYLKFLCFELALLRAWMMMMVVGEKLFRSISSNITIIVITDCSTIPTGYYITWSLYYVHIYTLAALAPSSVII
jgi:hypothetical protein